MRRAWGRGPLPILAPTATRRLISACLSRTPQVGSSAVLDQLTDRERDVLRLIGYGLSNTEIAAELVVSENTVMTHVSRVFAQLGVRDRAQAVVVAYQTGLVTAGRALHRGCGRGMAGEIAAGRGGRASRPDPRDAAALISRVGPMGLPPRSTGSRRISATVSTTGQGRRLSASGRKQPGGLRRRR